ncbi:MAG: 1,4-dihydroxy-2-naphthoate polyprenyltransferase [Actinomycetota bacterium]
MRVWIQGARPRTLPAAVVPVAVGTAVAAQEGPVTAWRALAALVVAVAIQVGTNYANDYHDGVRGTDDDRVGPVRLVASGLASPASVKRAAFASFAIAAVAGLVLAAAVGWELIAVGAASFLAGWYYTGGDKPYGYRGLGEVFVFVFFGLVATVGSAYVQTGEITGLAVLAAVPVGLLATALLVINNLRDIPTDAATGKRTLAVRMGDPATRRLYAGMIAAAFAFVVAVAFVHVGAALALGGLAFAARPVGRVLAGADGLELVPVLADTGRLQLVTGLLLAGGLWITA